MGAELEEESKKLLENREIVLKDKKAL